MDGIIPLWKEKGMTSHDCVFKLRKILQTKKVGHTGTLDPDVEGVLPICIGRATKLAEYITDEGKTYEATITLGTATTTEDASGEVVSQKAISETILPIDAEKAAKSFIGEIEQIPPMYSAVKVNGRKLYEYAREGIEVERPKRTVNIYAIELLKPYVPISPDNNSFRIRIHCGKGTYIRTLAVMIGEKLGYPAHMSELKRTQSGIFKEEQCFTLAEIEKLRAEEDEASYLYPLEDGLSDMKKQEISDLVYEKVLNGVVLPEQFIKERVDGRVALLHKNKLTAIYVQHPERRDFWKPEKVIELRPGKLN
ncbi:tRNA pseudouridine(55) synthase TruB [Listeria weihenstephanensis]|uniref:tRNA pseudouridine synthase B n=1 Tax=Listeria weihenstephanensis TaxID=1006155 RepID=A0A841ZCK4_9LIST|nr:tRNA pseudouridine(55) synthase TruB [Listeria weihenstephanensis]MBC1502003.1 tRNA pseudouridine(55) synthase TruB [Listeria weihenstephanensis]